MYDSPATDGYGGEEGGGGAVGYVDDIPFRAQHTVVLSELGEAEKERYLTFLLDSGATPAPDGRGNYVCNARIVAPGFARRPEIGRGGVPGQPGRDSDEDTVVDGQGGQGGTPASAGRKKKRTPGSRGRPGGGGGGGGGGGPLFDYSVYPRFASFITARDRLEPKKRPLSWLMRAIEEIYDARYTHDTAELKGEEEGGGGGGGGGAGDRMSNIFPVFVVDFFSKRYGLRSLVDQTCWDTLFNMHALRKRHLEVEVYARFIEEFYDADDLLFFLYVRSVVQKMLGIPMRNRWNDARGDRVPKTLVLDRRQCVSIARTVFGSDQDPMFQEFMAMVDQELVGSSEQEGGGPADESSARIEVTHFLHLAVVGYHETRPEAQQQQQQQQQQDEEEQGYYGEEGGQQQYGEEQYDEQQQQQYGDYAGQVADDRAAVDAMEQDAYAMGQQQQQGGMAMPPPPPPQGGAMTDEEAYKDLILRLYDAADRHSAALVAGLVGGACAGLPEEVVGEIQAEVAQQMDNKVEMIVRNVSREPHAPPTEEYEALVAPENAPMLEEAFRMAAAAGGAGGGDMAAASDEAVDGLGEAIVGLPELRAEIEPLVDLLQSYAASRLQEAD